MLGGTTKKLGQAVPGGWGESNPSEEVDPKEQGNLAAGVVGKSGQILDDAGNTVGQITEGDAGSLVGNVVTATGDIVGKDGGIVGKALPLDQLTGEGKPKEDAEAKSGGFSVLGAAKGVKGVVDTVDGTVQTVNRTVPIVGDITKGLGLGGGGGNGSQEGETPKAGGSGLLGGLGGLLGSKPEERDPEEKAKVTEDAKQDLFEEAGKATDDAPIDLKDKDVNPAETVQTEVETKSQPPQSESDSKTDYTEPTPGVEAGEKDLTAISPDDARIPDDAKDAVDADAAKDKLPEDAQDKLPEDAQDKLPDDVEGAAKDNLPEGAKDKVPEDVPDTGDVDDVKDEAKDKLPEDAKPEDVPEGEINLEDKTGDIPEEAKSKLDDIETVTVPGDKLPAPFEKFEGAQIDDEGKVMFEDESIGKVVDGDPEQLAGQEIKPDGAIVNEEGEEIGRVELKSDIAEELAKEAQESLSILKGCTVNKGGNLVNDKNEAIGRITEGILKHMIGRKADEQGQIWNDSGAVIGRAELIPEKDRQAFKEPSPFEDFPDAIVQSNGEVTSNGEIIGRLIEGDAKKLKGKHVDEDGDVQDRMGNVLGKAERWEPEPEAEPEPEPEVDKSILAGKRCNKAGYVVDSSGSIYGRVVDGDIKRLAGRMCNKNGEIVSESGDVLGHAELVSEGEREGFKEGPFAELPGCTVARDGTVVTPSGDIVGRLTQGDAKVLFGRSVDEDGDVLDRNGNQIGKAERWEPEPEPEKKKGPMAGRRVNKKGEVVDEDGNIIGKLTSGELSICSGKEIDDDNDVVDSKGRTVGGVSLIEDIPDEPEPEESAEDKKKREEAEKDEKLAKDLGGMIEQGLEKIRPITRMITDKIDKAERTPKEELDEEELVKQVKPLIEEGGKILTELNGSIRALDPDGRIQRNAKHKSNTREATPAEYHLADVLKELTGNVTTCIDNAKRKIEDMPHAKKELNPLWGLLTEPLFQILAAVGLLLTGVLNLVGRLLNGLGLGGIVDGLLGTLGLNRLLDGLGLGSITSALTGKNQKKK